MKTLNQFFYISTIMFVIIREFLIVEQTFHLPQVKRSVIISNKLVYTSSLLRNREISRKSQNFIELLPSTQSSSANKNFVSTTKNLIKNRNRIFPVVHYFTLKLEFVSNILWIIVFGNSFLFLTCP